MKRLRRSLLVATTFALTFVLIGCQHTPSPTPKAKKSTEATPSVGREYGETLHGAITQAQQAQKTVEQSADQALHSVDNTQE